MLALLLYSQSISLEYHMVLDLFFSSVDFRNVKEKKKNKKMGMFALRL